MDNQDTQAYLKEEVVIKQDPIELKIDDDKLVRILDDRRKASRKFFKEEYNLFERREINEKYLLGKQIDKQEKDKKLKPYEARYLDNALYEIEASIKPLAMSRLPDMIVTPGSESPDKEQTAQDISKVVDTDIKKRQNRTTLGIAFKHLPVYFTGIIKMIWSPQLNDFKFIVVHPDRVDVDHTCTTNDADDMSFISEILPITIQECFIRFPKKKEELTVELRKGGVVLTKDGDLTQKELATSINIREIWFDWEVPKGEQNEDGEQEFEEVNGVIWKYGDVVLKKIKNPNYDWEGEQKLMVYEDERGREPTPEEMLMAAMQGTPIDGMKVDTVYRNYFDQPRKPYFFMGYDQWRKMPYDETSRIEQNLRNQQALDKAGKKIVEKMGQRVKHVWSKESGLTPAKIKEMDLDDPKQDVLVNGEISKVHTTVEPEQITPAEFKFLDEDRQRMYSLAGASAVRGEMQSDVATTNQIAREADFTRADDLVEDTINTACEWMADWSLQMIKLRYTDYHFRKLLGAQGSVTFVKLRSDMVEDGMEVMIKASGTDKLKTRNQAMEMAGMQLIDPLSFYEDLGLSDPKGRAERLLLMQANPMEYLAKFVMELGDSPEEMATTLNGTPPSMAAPPVAGMTPPPVAGGQASIPSVSNPEVGPVPEMPEGL